jgi:hypothetical protein
LLALSIYIGIYFGWEESSLSVAQKYDTYAIARIILQSHDANDDSKYNNLPNDSVMGTHYRKYL